MVDSLPSLSREMFLFAWMVNSLLCLSGWFSSLHALVCFFSAFPLPPSKKLSPSWPSIQKVLPVMQVPSTPSLWDPHCEETFLSFHDVSLSVAATNCKLLTRLQTRPTRRWKTSSMHLTDRSGSWTERCVVLLRLHRKMAWIIYNSLNELEFSSVTHWTWQFGVEFGIVAALMRPSSSMRP